MCLISSGFLRVPKCQVRGSENVGVEERGSDPSVCLWPSSPWSWGRRWVGAEFGAPRGPHSLHALVPVCSGIPPSLRSWPLQVLIIMADIITEPPEILVLSMRYF